MEPVLLSEAAYLGPTSASARDIHAATEAARLAGWGVYTLAPEGVDGEELLARVPDAATVRPAFWAGFIPSVEHYSAVYDEARQHNLLLPNTPEEHQNAQEFDRFYSLLGDLTPQSRIVTAPGAAAEAVAQLGLPVFVKGIVQSRKADGWKSCVAESVPELETLVADLLRRPQRTRGRVAVRKLVRLRHSRTVPGTGFPLGREFRAFVYRGETVGLGYYWEGDDPLRRLSSQEEADVRTVVTEAAYRVQTPYLTVDVGQDEGGRWWVIETGDAQFSGASQVPLLGLYNRLRQATVSDRAEENEP